MTGFLSFVRFLAPLVLAIAAQGSVAHAQPSQPTESDELALSQSKLADRYQRLEKLILRMAEFDQANNPRRAELLKNAFALAKDRDIQLQLEAASRMLESEKLQGALGEQQQARRDLQSLLELLLTENRADRLKSEQARVRDYIREIERLERMQRSVQARTEGGVDVDQLGREQNQVAEAAQQLHENMRETEVPENPLNADSDPQSDSPKEASDNSSGEKQAESKPGPPANTEPSGGSESNEGESSDKSSQGKQDRSSNRDDKQPATEKEEQPRENPLRKPSDDRQSENKNQFRSEEGDSSEGETPRDGSSDGSQGESPSDSKPGDAAPSSNPPQSGESPSGSSESGGDTEATPPPEQDFPGLQQVQEAEQKMRDAEQKLAKAKRDGAIEDQREAAKKLAEAKAELEKILRQMREEEIERVLAALEARFRKMLEMQLRVYEDTLRVARIPEQDRDRFVEIEAGKLSFQERRIVVEADKCLNVLYEEGSSVAFPESTQQMRDDMQQVTDLLAAANVGRLTQGIEEDIIEALEEMIGALEQAQSDQEQRKQNPQASQPMPPGEMPLVNAIAELKMLKALQVRINRRTSRYAAMLDNMDDPVGRPVDDRLFKAVQELAERQQRLHEITRDISIGKNK